jgi:hypothetical protein
MIKRQGPTATPTTTPEQGQGRPKDAEIRERIGHELRSLFEDVVGAAVPERFRRLLEELERKSDKKS